MNLIKLMPEQLVGYWDMLRIAIMQTFAQRDLCTPKHLQYILASLLSGKSQCWMGFKDEAGEKKFTCFVITRIIIEPGIGEKVLSIDALYSYNGIPDELFELGKSVLTDFALLSGCSTITAMTDNPKIAEITKKFGFKTRYYLVAEV